MKTLVVISAVLASASVVACAPLPRTPAIVYSKDELDSKCIAAAGTKLRQTVGLEATDWRALPLYVQGQPTKPNERSVELDTLNTEQKQTYVFMCAAFENGFVGVSPLGRR